MNRQGKIPIRRWENHRASRWGFIVHADDATMRRTRRPTAGNDFGKAVSRILSTPCGGENHLSQQPIPGTRSLSRTAAGRCKGPLFGLAPDGVFRASSLALRAVRSYRTFSPLPACCHAGGLFSVALSVNAPLGSVARVYLRPEERSYAASRPDGVRTFLLPLARKAILRLPKIVRKVSAVSICSKTAGNETQKGLNLELRNSGNAPAPPFLNPEFLNSKFSHHEYEQSPNCPLQKFRSPRP